MVLPQRAAGRVQQYYSIVRMTEILAILVMRCRLIARVAARARHACRAAAGHQN